MWSFAEEEEDDGKKWIITNEIIGWNITVYVVANKNYVSFNNLAKFYLKMLEFSYPKIRWSNRDVVSHSFYDAT